MQLVSSASVRTATEEPSITNQEEKKLRDGISDYASQVLYIGKFLTEQGYLNVQVILEQDNKAQLRWFEKGAQPRRQPDL